MAATDKTFPPGYFPNLASKDRPLSSLPETRPQLITSLTSIVVGCPPANPWVDTSGFKEEPQGLWTGPTALAYLFHRLSKTHPDLQIEGRSTSDWCLAYLDCGSDKIPIAGKSIGIKNEYMAYNTVKAIATHDLASVEKVKDGAIAFNKEADAAENEFKQGRAGILALLRIIRHWIPETATELDPVMDSIIEHCLQNQPWIWGAKPLSGAAHGSIGIITQIMLSRPHYASRVEPLLITHLDAQRPNGNWYCRSDKADFADNPDRVYYTQFCHGAPGFVFSLLKLRAHFPTLQTRIDGAVRLARQCIWEEGLLKKEPNLCHGITGNALALDAEQGAHFMSFATKEIIQKGYAEDGAYILSDDRWGLMWGEAGRAWGWIAFDINAVEELGWPVYTDV